MRLRSFATIIRWGLPSATWCALLTSSVSAQYQPNCRYPSPVFVQPYQPCQPYPAPSVQPAPAPAPSTAPAPSPAQPSTTPTEPTSPQAQAPEAQQPQTPDLGQEQAAAGEAEQTAMATPNIMGDLLYGYRSATFQYLRAGGFINVIGTGGNTVVNPQVADNNSPLPRDRIYLRYNHFQDAQSVTGFAAPSNIISSGGTTVLQSFPATKLYNVDQYTFGFEKTFFNRRASFEYRLPIFNGLSSQLNLSAGNMGAFNGGVDANGNPTFNVANTPGNTLGNYNTQWGNMTFILKGLAYRSQTLNWGGGLSFVAPTAPDQKIHLHDFTGTSASGASGVRDRDIHVNNSTWAMSPFLAGLWTPGTRFFLQGFGQIDIPLNSSHITYIENRTGVFAPATPAQILSGQSLTPPFRTDTDITDQTLMHLNLGTGYWVTRNPENRWLNGWAPTMELHYTTTLSGAHIVTLPGDNSFIANPANPFQAIPEPNAQVGNQRNRLDILDMTVGSTFIIANRATLATGFAFPLRGADNRTYDWEAQVFLNYYFGKSRPSGGPFAPNF